MLTRVLHADLHPFVVVSVTGAGHGHVDASITINGVTRRSRIPIDIQSRGDDFRASGVLALDQTDFGITPLSLLGGAIQVQNRVDIRFSVDAHRMEPAASR
jgi:polyisoprenoid-binding protein YceI